MATGSCSSDDELMFPSFSSAPKSVAAIEAKRSSKERRHPSSHRDKRKTRDKHRHSSQSPLTKYKPRSKAYQPSALHRILESGDLTMDRYGDRDLLRYQSSSTSGAPKFHRNGGRRVLGLRGSMRVVETESDSRFVQLAPPTTRALRYIDTPRVGSNCGADYVATSTEMATMSELHAGYIALTDSASGDEAKESLYDSDHGGVDFRTLDGMAKATPRPCKAPRQLQSDPVHGQLRAKIAIFEAKLNSDKHDVDAWISYIGLQEQVAMSAFTKRMRGNVAIARMQIEMFQRAIGLNPKSKRLWTEYLMRCQDVLETTELLAEWIKALSETEDPDMIFSYVDFCQGLSDRFTVSWMIDRFDYAIQLLTRVLCSSRRDTAVVRRTSILITHIIHRSCLLLRESGCCERATSLYQAAIEWFMFCPEHLKMASLGHRKHAFERFWDSGMPRIGSPGANGWSSFGKGAYSSSEMALAKANTIGTALESEWLGKEIEYSQECNEPLTIPALDIPTEPTNMFDPFAVTLFEDIEPFLADIPWDKDVFAVLLDNLFRFLGLISPDTCVFSDRQAGQLQGVSRDFEWSMTSNHEEILPSVKRTAAWQSMGSSNDSTDGSGGGSRSGGGEWIDGILVARQSKTAFENIHDTGRPHFAYISVPITLDLVETPLPYRFSCPWLKPASEWWRGMTQRTLEKLSVAASLNTRQQLMVRVALVEWSGAHWPEYFDQLSSQIRDRKPVCLPLLNSLAKTYAHRGCWEQARTIWSQALGSISDKSTAEDWAWAVVVQKSWAVSELLHGQGIGKFQQISQVQAGFSCNRNYSEFETIETRCAAYELQMWSAYLHGRSTDSADAAHAHAAAGGPREEEQLGLVLTSIYFYHMQNCRLAPPRAMRLHLKNQLAKFPHLTIYWEMLLASESHSAAGFHILRQVENTPPSPLLAMHVLATMNVPWESRLTRMQCRSALAWAVCLAAGAARGGRVGASRMKRLAFMAVKMCPWAKPLYLLAMGMDCMSGVEKTQLLTAVVTRGLRTRVFVAERAQK